MDDQDRLVKDRLLRLKSKQEAFDLIADQSHWSSRKKAQERYMWRERNEPNKINRCPAKGKREKKEKQKSPMNNVYEAMVRDYLEYEKEQKK